MRKNNDLVHITRIKTFYATHHRFPSYQEIQKLANMTSRSSVFQFLCRLVNQNIIEKDSKGKISPLPLFFARPSLGIVEAGFGFDGTAIPDTSQAIDEYLVERPEATFMLTVKGESMIDAGILPGDIIIVERAHEAKNGSIIIAEVDGSWTIKYYKNIQGKTILSPANTNMRPYSPKESFRITGIVKGVIRKYS